MEHWDVIEAWRPETPSGRSQIGGTTEVTDLAETDRNKSQVRAFVERVLIEGDHRSLNEFVASDLVQHDLGIENGASAWLEDLEKRRVRYTELFKLIGQGNFVVTHCKVGVDSQPYAIFDVFRLAGRRIVERWMNSEVVPEDTGNSGKF